MAGTVFNVTMTQAAGGTVSYAVGECTTIRSDFVKPDWQHLGSANLGGTLTVAWTAMNPPRRKLYAIARVKLSALVFAATRATVPPSMRTPETVVGADGDPQSNVPHSVSGWLWWCSSSTST